MLLKDLESAIRTTLLELFNLMWIRETAPDSWKVARVIPILKPGKSPLGSFGPVSLTSCLCKEVEKMVDSRLQGQCEQARVLSDYVTGLEQGCYIIWMLCLKWSHALNMEAYVGI